MPRPVRWFWRTCWLVVAPLLCLTITVIGFTTREQDQEPGEADTVYVYPPAAQALGWLIELSPLAFVLMVTLWTVITNWLNKQPIAFLRGE